MPSAVIAITGASGSRYAVRLIQILVDSGWDIFLTVTREGAINLDLECGVTPKQLAEEYGVNLEANQNLAARSASGSAKFDAYVICPASGTTIGKIAAGISDNLATRSALVALKKKKADFGAQGDACCNTSSGSDGQALFMGRRDSSRIPWILQESRDY